MANRQKTNLADILVQSGVITSEQLAKALKTQTTNGGILSEVLVKMGFATDEAIAVATSKQLNIPYASRENGLLKVEENQNLDKLVEEKYARENIVLPLFLDDKSLAVAMSDPENVIILENLKIMTGYEISPFISTRAQILKMIDQIYSGSELLDEMVMSTQGKPDDSDAALDVDISGDRLDLDKMLSAAKGTQIVGYVNAMLKQAIAERVSDIHLESFDQRGMLRFRIDGVLFERSAPSKDLFGAIVSRIKILSRLDISERRLPQDGEFSMKIQNRVVDVRVSTCPTVFGEKVVMRILDKGAVNLNVSTLGFEPKQREDFLTASQYPHGLIFLTGPTGSGKTTTLYAVLNTVKSVEKNIMTIEDPVEIKLDGINQVQAKTQIGLTFASALRSFLRQDPDVILVGEVRDQETAQICLRASLTGHLVLSTLHTNSALEAVFRLIDLGIEPFLLSSSLALVAAQRLVRILCKSCRVPSKPSKDLLETCLKEARFPNPPNPNDVMFYAAKGCPRCSGTGYSGRKGIYEVYLMNNEIREMIAKKGVNLNELKAVTEKAGILSLRSSGWRKVVEGLTTPEEIMSVTLGE